jgi:hypothetical protein
MTVSSVLSIAGFGVAAFGSSLGMWGIFKQANGYFGFQSTFPQFVENLARLLRTLLRRGWSDVSRQISIDNEFSELRPENRVTSVMGFYAVFLGFLLQLVGGLIALLGSIFSNA